jgi:hypothetical protein
VETAAEKKVRVAKEYLQTLDAQLAAIRGCPTKRSQSCWRVCLESRDQYSIKHRLLLEAPPEG